MTAWQLCTVAMALLVSTAQSLHEFHLDKSKDLFIGYGIGFKYPSELLLVSKKLIQRKGMKLESRSEYDLILTLKVNGTLRGPKDGILVNLSPDNVNDKIESYEPSDARDMGFVNKLHGLVIAVRQSSKSQGNGTHMDLNVFARFFESQLNVKENQVAKTLNMDSEKFAKDFHIEKDSGQFDIIIRHQDSVVKVYVKPSPSQPPIFLYVSSKAVAIRKFFLSLSASTVESYVGVSVPSIILKSDLQNADVTYFENHDFHEKTEVFNYIHHMHDVLKEDAEAAEPEIDIKKLDDKEIIGKMLDYQRIAIDHMRPVNAILTVAGQEISSIFNYLETYRNISKDYFVKIVKQVDKMLYSTNQHFETLASDIDQLTSKLNNGKLVQVATKAHKQMKATVQEISTLESKLKKAAQEIQKLNEQVAEGSQFFEKFENLLKELPDSIRQELEQVTQTNSNVFSIIGKTIGYLVLLAAVVGFGAICLSLGGMTSGEKSGF